MKKQIISEEFKRMQVLAGLITESQLNEIESNLVSYLTSLEKNISKKPQALATEITNYLNTILIQKSIKNLPNQGLAYLGKGKVEPFLKIWAYIDKNRGFVANEEILKFLVKADDFLSNEKAEEVVKAYLKDQQLTGANEKFGGFEKMTDTLHPNDPPHPAKKIQ